MVNIANFLQTKILFKENNAMVFNTQTKNNHYLTKEYFDKYPLMISKYLDYLCFLKGLNYLGRGLTEKEIIKK